MAVPTNPNIPSLPSGQPADTDQEAEGAGWLRLLIMSLKTLFVTPPPSDNSTTPATTAYVQTAILNAVLPGASLPAQSGNAGKFLQTDGANVSWQSAGSIIRVPIAASQAVTVTNKSNLLDCNGTGIVLTFTASAILGQGWGAYLTNSGTDPVTLTPNGAETIQGRSTWPLNGGDVLLLLCDGSNLTVTRLEGDAQLGIPGSAVVSVAAATTALGTCALSSGRSVGIYRNAAGNPQVNIRTAAGTVAATVQLEASAMATTAPQVVPLTATTALVAWASSGATALRVAVITDNGATIAVGTIVSVVTLVPSVIALSLCSALKVIIFYNNTTSNIQYSAMTVAGTVITAPGGANFISADGSVSLKVAPISATQGVVLYAGATSGLSNSAAYTEASGTVTAGVARTISVNGTSAGGGGDVVFSSATRCVAVTGIGGGSSNGFALTIDLAGTGSTATLTTGEATPVAASGGANLRLVKVSNATFLTVGQDTAAISPVLTPIYMRGQRAYPGVGIPIAISATLQDACLLGTSILTFYADAANSNFPTSKPIPLGSVA